MCEIAGIPPWSAMWSSGLEQISALGFRIINTFVHGDKDHSFKPHDGPVLGPGLGSASPVAY